MRRGKSPFRFENMWSKEVGFKDLIRNWWVSDYIEGSFSHILATQLKALKLDLKAWNKEIFDNVASGY